MLTIFESIKKPQGKIINVSSMDRLADAICSYIWSPNIFKDNYRKKANFIKTPMIVLDCDDGMTIEQAISIFGKFKHIIGTTRNHQKKKNDKPACDRFRIVLFLDCYCRDSALYQYNMKMLCDTFGFDKSCAEYGRLFYPCQHIVSKNFSGERWGLREIPTTKKTGTKSTKRYKRITNIKKVDHVLAGNLLAGQDSRHLNLFWVAAELGRQGYTLGEVMCQVQGTYLYNILTEEDGNAEIERQINNGHKEGFATGFNGQR